MRWWRCCTCRCPWRSKRRPMRSAWPSSLLAARRTNARSWPGAPPSSSGAGARNPRTWCPGGPTIPGQPRGPSAPDAAPLAPVASLRAYYEALNTRHYAQTWDQLAPQFKRTHFCCAADGRFQFERYRAWWEQVARVEVLDAHVQERQPAAVVIEATVRYVMRRGTVTEERHQFRLVAEPATQRWLIAAQTRGMQRPRAR